MQAKRVIQQVPSQSSIPSSVPTPSYQPQSIPTPQQQPQPMPPQGVTNRQTSLTPQSHLHQQQQMPQRAGPQQQGHPSISAPVSVPTATPLSAGPSAVTSSAPGGVATPVVPNSAPAPTMGPSGPTQPTTVPPSSESKGQQTPSKARSKSVTSPGGSSTSSGSGGLFSLQGIIKPAVPSIPISGSVDVKPPTIVTFNSNADTRPTLTGGAANTLSILLDSPAIMKLPTFELADGSASAMEKGSGRVLKKRKLTDLVSTMGVDEGDGKTNIDGNVEELLLDLADEFIHSVTSFACRLAKHRKVDSIDAKDVQLHLERNWNIKIPGYATDEIRSTRRLQPSTSYNQKVQGVEISKAVSDDMTNL
ncbi:uncharacterized protein SPAPADRAFT_59700 [Spathaspora passalidarum NRRL Y-27907]|uniref:TBP-associated factor 12 n=1 Tax=Spathaspora passalidarum (strain NRRL Y-27907 / 11-Y1) TaxID=619300 RepID=G3AHW7_SPAPN|nr:uncharacterized protein SPAPADRAFT_59700 [Spathaspora passalidarum NRRL Y-27907]EGW34281.1 hypothetical protein SPAPADRAFT_59700 [Spathaspora passalidarum NRRL Y-27907]